MPAARRSRSARPGPRRRARGREREAKGEPTDRAAPPAALRARSAGWRPALARRSEESGARGFPPIGGGRSPANRRSALRSAPRARDARESPKAARTRRARPAPRASPRPPTLRRRGPAPPPGPAPRGAAPCTRRRGDGPESLTVLQWRCGHVQYSAWQYQLSTKTPLPTPLTPQPARRSQDHVPSWSDMHAYL